MLALKVLPASMNPFLPGPKPLLSGFTGLAKPGEMVLVLGRPGSGCSTFLKSIAGNRKEYLGVHGDVFYSGMEATEFIKRYKGETVYNPEGMSFFAPHIHITLPKFQRYRRRTLRNPHRQSNNPVRTINEDTRKASAQHV